LVAESYSVNPTLLLATLEHQSGWVRARPAAWEDDLYPMGWREEGYEGLYRQMAWTADQLNAGFYRWRAGWAGPYLFGDGAVVPPGPGLNAGTVAVQHLFSLLYEEASWRTVVGEGGFVRTLRTFTPNPFLDAVEPLVPVDLAQPPLRLPFEEGATWSFTGGPHSAWGNWAAWGALDFAPPGNAFGCVPSQSWVVAAAKGLVVRTGEGQILQDLDGDGSEQTGWVLLYMHVEARDRVEEGVMLQAGDRIGHPSCEGGVSTGTHLHLARKFNGLWIPADGDLPFLLDGWVSEGAGLPYEGTLSKGSQVLYAHEGRASYNQISR
jgi:murein DD-endopeptidase MepM/ murein hydrolase activator NlpD